MTKLNNTLYSLNIAIFQNGVLISDYHRPLRKLGLIRLGSSEKNNLTIPGYTFNKKIRLLKLKKQALRLFFDLPWSGQVGSHESLRPIVTEKRKYVDLTEENFGLLRHQDLTLAFNLISADRLKEIDTTPLDKKYKNTFFKAPETPNAAMAWSISVVAALAVIGAMVGGLYLRPTYRAKNFSDLKQEQVLPFVSPSTIELAPEILQTKYSARKVLSQLIEYNTDLVGSYLGFMKNSSFLFPSTLQHFQLLNKQYTKTLRTLIKDREKQNETMAMRNRATLIFIPSVIGEGIEQKVARSLKKGQQIELALRTNLEERRSLTTSLLQGENYNLTDYKAAVVKEKNKFNKEQLEYLSKASYRSGQTPEASMYGEMSKLANMAKSRQYDLSFHSYSQPLISIALATRDFSTTFTHSKTELSDAHIYRVEETLLALDETRLGIKQMHFTPMRTQVSGDYLSSLKKAFPLIKSCYKKAVRRHPDTAGTMVWEWQIDLPGKPFGIKLGLSDIKNHAMELCIRNALNQVAYRSSRENLGKIFTHSFIFAPE